MTTYTALALDVLVMEDCIMGSVYGEEKEATFQNSTETHLTGSATVDEQACGWMDNWTEGGVGFGMGGVMFHAADRRRMTNAPLCSCPR